MQRDQTVVSGSGLRSVFSWCLEQKLLPPVLPRDPIFEGCLQLPLRADLPDVIPDLHALHPKYFQGCLEDGGDDLVLQVLRQRGFPRYLCIVGHLALQPIPKRRARRLRQPISGHSERGPVFRRPDCQQARLSENKEASLGQRTRFSKGPFLRRADSQKKAR